VPRVNQLTVGNGSIVLSPGNFSPVEYSYGDVDFTTTPVQSGFGSFTNRVVAPNAAAGTAAATLSTVRQVPEGFANRALGTSSIDSTAVDALDPGKGSKFTIGYTDIKGVAKAWNFVLLPAIETNLSLGNSSPLVRGSGGTIPDVKPGILTHSVMRLRSIPIPGSVPIVQTIGIESRITELVGAFIGTENKVDGTNGLSGIYQDSDGSLSDPATSAGAVAETFRDKVVDQGAPVTVLVATPGRKLKITGVIQAFKLYEVRYNRAYYSIQILHTQYAANEQVVASEANQISANVAPKPEASQVAGGTKDNTKDLQNISNRILDGVKNAVSSGDGTSKDPYGNTFNIFGVSAGPLLENYKILRPSDRQKVDEKLQKGLAQPAGGQ
jgi:hypothetical protein